MSKFEIFKDRKGKYRFRLIATNGRIVCQSEGYTRKANCRAGIMSVQYNAPKAVIAEVE